MTLAPGNPWKNPIKMWTKEKNTYKTEDVNVLFGAAQTCNPHEKHVTSYKIHTASKHVQTIRCLATFTAKGPRVRKADAMDTAAPINNLSSEEKVRGSTCFVSGEEKILVNFSVSYLADICTKKCQVSAIWKKKAGYWSSHSCRCLIFSKVFETFSVHSSTSSCFLLPSVLPQHFLHLWFTSAPSFFPSFSPHFGAPFSHLSISVPRFLVARLALRSFWPNHLPNCLDVCLLVILSFPPFDLTSLFYTPPPSPSLEVFHWSPIPPICDTLWPRKKDIFLTPILCLQSCLLGRKFATRILRPTNFGKATNDMYPETLQNKNTTLLGQQCIFLFVCSKRRLLFLPCI